LFFTRFFCIFAHRNIFYRRMGRRKIHFEVDKSLVDEITEYCHLNGIEDVEGEMNSMLRKAFMILKYGETPFKNALTEMVENKDKPKKEGAKKNIKKEELVVEKEVAEEIKEQKQEIETTSEEPKVIRRRTVKIVKKNKDD